MPKNLTFYAAFLAMHMFQCRRRAKWSVGKGLAASVLEREKKLVLSAIVNLIIRDVFIFVFENQKYGPNA